MFKLQQIIRANMGELAKNITSEQGKTLVDAEGDVLRGLRKFPFPLLIWHSKSNIPKFINTDEFPLNLFRGRRTYVQHNKFTNG